MYYKERSRLPPAQNRLSTRHFASVANLSGAIYIYYIFVFFHVHRERSRRVEVVVVEAIESVCRESVRFVRFENPKTNATTFEKTKTMITINFETNE